jgi:Ca-activated chloride channel family protein
MNAAHGPNPEKIPSFPRPAVSRRPRAWRACHALGLALLLAGAAFGPGPSLAPASAQTAPTPPAAARLDAHSEQGGTVHLPLLREAVDVRVDDGHATAAYEHVFQNESTARLEGNYALVVGEGATATGFSYWNGEDKIVGEVFEKEAAQQVYEALTGLRKDPGLLEQTGEGAFAFRVFPIEPGEKKKIAVTTSRWLPRREGKLEYRVRLAKPDADVKVELRDARGVGDVESPTHELALEPFEGGVRVRPTKAKVAGADELVLRYGNKEPALVLRVATHASEGGAAYFTATLETPQGSKAPRPAHDVTLVIDRSGSMEGGSIEAARTAAKRLVDHLRDDDAVNVIAFDDKAETLFDHPRTLTPEVRRDVERYLGALATRGGTDIAAALAKSLATQTKDARPDLVLFLTDGQSDGPKAVAVAEKDASDTRVFTIGLGSGVDKALLTRIAATKKGRFTFVADARAVEAELSRVLEQLEAPMLTDLHLAGDGVTTTNVYPAVLPDLFANDQLRLFGRVSGSGKLVLEAKQAGMPRRFEVAVDGAAPAARPWVARAWARSRVDDLLEAERGSSEAKVHEEIVDLGLAWELVTPYTSFLAIPEKELTKNAADATKNMRERRAKLLAQNKDAAALSRLAMPPGDPVLRVRAPKDAKRVTAMFPFGLTVSLEWDAFVEQWSTRFLVPKDVRDGEYEVPVVIEHASGRVEATRVRYVIDAKEPSVQVDVRPVAGGVEVRAVTDEPSREVRVAPDGDARRAVSLVASADGRTFTGFVPLAPGAHALRVVAADKALNETDRTISLEVQ